jgi:hypothetical protein
LQRCIDLTDYGGQGLITHLHPRSSQHRPKDHPPYEEFRRGKARDSFLSVHAHLVESRDFEHRPESVGITQTKDGGHQRCRLSTDVSLQPSRQGKLPRIALEGAPHGDGEATAWNQHAVRLS